MSESNIPQETQETIIQITDQVATQADLSIISLIMSSDFIGSGLLTNLHNFKASTRISKQTSINAKTVIKGKEAPNKATKPYCKHMSI